MATSVFPRMHVSLYVSDLTATVNFYTAFFGQPATKIRRGYAKYVLDQPSLIISFVENAERVQSTPSIFGNRAAMLPFCQSSLLYSASTFCR